MSTTIQNWSTCRPQAQHVERAHAHRDHRIAEQVTELEVTGDPPPHGIAREPAQYRGRHPRVERLQPVLKFLIHPHEERARLPVDEQHEQGGKPVAHHRSRQRRQQPGQQEGPCERSAYSRQSEARHLRAPALRQRPQPCQRNKKREDDEMDPLRRAHILTVAQPRFQRPFSPLPVAASNVQVHRPNHGR